MIKETNNISDIQYILDNLRKEDEEELIAQLGLNWKEKMLNYSAGKIFKILYGVDNVGKRVPIAIGGFTELSEKDPTIACVWLLSTNAVLKNKRLFFQEIKKQLIEAEKKYTILYNYIYKSNYTAKSWLKNLGFKFDKAKPVYLPVKKDFEFFYKLIERE